MTMGILTATATSLGTGTTKTQLNGGSAVTMPSWAKELVAVVPYMTLVTMTASQALIAKLELESTDCHIQPFECAPTPQQGGLGTTHDVHAATPDIFEVHCPLQGGEEINVYGTALISNTVAPYMGASLVVSSVRTGRQIFRKCGTLTNSATTAGETAGTAYTINGSEQIIEVCGLTAKKDTMTASQPCHGFVRLQSSDFKVAVPLKFLVTPQPAGLGTIGTPSIGGLARFPVRVPTNSTCNIQDYFTNGTTLTAAAEWLSQVAFYQVGRN